MFNSSVYVFFLGLYYISHAPAHDFQLYALVFYLVHFSAAIFIPLCRPFVVLIHSFTSLALVLVCIFSLHVYSFFGYREFFAFHINSCRFVPRGALFYTARFSLCYQVAALLRRIEALESTQKSNSVEDGLSRLGAYGLTRRKCDFDKYIALSIADDLVATAKELKHSKALFLAAAAHALRDRIEKPLDQFQAYFLALFSDEDYAKVLDSIGKLDKALRVQQKSAPSAQVPVPSTSSANSSRSTRYLCNFCGIAGHTAPFCYRLRRSQACRGRYSPYPQSRRGKSFK